MLDARCVDIDLGSKDDPVVIANRYGLLGNLD
jgi:hypothetical protein